MAVLFNAWDFVSLWIDHDRAYEETQVQVQTLAREVSRTLTSTLQPVEIHLTDHLVPAASRLVTGRGSPKQMQEVFKLTRQRLPQVAAVMVFDNVGRLAAASVPGVRPEPDPRNIPGIAQHRDAGDDLAVFVGDAALVLADPKGSRWRLHMTQALRNAEGDFIGMVMVQLDTESIFAIIGEMNIVTGAAVRIFDGSARLLVNHPRDFTVIGRAFSRTRLFKTWQEVRHELVGRLPDPTDNSPEIAALRGIERYPLLVSVGVAEDLALAEWWRELAILLLTIVVFVTASSWAGRRQLAKWVLHLNGKGEEEKGFADGDGI
ncbi:MAG: hypothetical protein HY055_13630 [Magnetospirillum sp.]|nr:hypothetical protein [Magnetospirillum sp.]